MGVDFAEVTTPHERTAADSERWLMFLSRWSLAVALAALSLPIVLFGGVGRRASDDAFGAGYAELLQAVRSPGVYRAAWTLDAVIWLMIGVSLVALAGILRRHAPIRATFVAFCGIGQLTGALGGLIRLDGITDLAELQAAAAPGQRAALLDSYLALWRIINPHYHLGTLLLGVGFLLAAWGVFSLRGFPRWLGAWLAVPGLLSAAQFVSVAAGVQFSLPLVYFNVAAGTVGLNLAMAIALWRPSTRLVSAVAGQSAGGSE